VPKYFTENFDFQCVKNTNKQISLQQRYQIAALIEAETTKNRSQKLSTFLKDVFVMKFTKTVNELPRNRYMILILLINFV